MVKYSPGNTTVSLLLLIVDKKQLIMKYFRYAHCFITIINYSFLIIN